MKTRVKRLKIKFCYSVCAVPRLNALESPVKERSKTSECHRKASLRRPSSPQQKTQGELWSLKVLTWLLSAEDGLQGQPPVSGNVEEVKEQFHTHEVSQSVVRAFSRFHISLKDLFICAAAEMRKEEMHPARAHAQQREIIKG